ncbi:MAG: hypothetical protein V2I43_07595 [Parvularcula sp.]|jgi:hypothetical protein|nr:hypothetical protein [Parvularcula sp.]
MEQAKETKPAKVRVARHRSRASAKGSRRVEVTVPSHDASLVKAIAGALRLGGKDAKRIRESVQSLVTAPKAQTGAELVAFFRNSPLVDAELSLERDRSSGRTVDLG